jgi:Fe-S cluster biogenesis protein NfuA/rhodanese-related sulfurtransferase
MEFGIWRDGEGEEGGPLDKGARLSDEASMFGKNQQQSETLLKKIEELTQRLDEQKRQQDHHLKVLRQQVAAMAVGIPPTPSSILSGLPYSEIPKEQVVDFIKTVPNLLILDVRTDEGWSNGHIPGAKHVPANQVLMRLGELSDKTRPILTFCANGNTGMTVAQLLAKEGYLHIFNALGGMAGYTGELERPVITSSSPEEVQGTDRALIARVLEIMDRDVRPGLKRDGGDLKVIAVEDGIVKVKMVGACVGCGAQKRTVEDGIKNHLMKMIPEIRGIADLS